MGPLQLVIVPHLPRLCSYQAALCLSVCVCVSGDVGGLLAGLVEGVHVFCLLFWIGGCIIIM